ncbi:hypothetical protein U1Q18_028130 [Sarracenia purpurea var. burkii]
MIIEVSNSSYSVDDSIGLLAGANFEDTTSLVRFGRGSRAIWGWDDSYLFIGNVKKGVDVISAAKRRSVATLHSPHISAIPCRFDAHPYKIGMLAGATSGGQVYNWTTC